MPLLRLRHALLRHDLMRRLPRFAFDYYYAAADDFEPRHADLSLRRAFH